MEKGAVRLKAENGMEYLRSGPAGGRRWPQIRVVLPCLHDQSNQTIAESVTSLVASCRDHGLCMSSQPPWRFTHGGKEEKKKKRNARGFPILLLRVI